VIALKRGKVRVDRSLVFRVERVIVWKLLDAKFTGDLMLEKHIVLTKRVVARHEFAALISTDVAVKIPDIHNRFVDA